MHINGMSVACLRKQQRELVSAETTDAKREAFHAEVDETITSVINDVAAPQAYAIAAEKLTPFREDPKKANSLLIIDDNAGKIVLDMVLVQTLHRLDPNLKVLYGVCGGYTQRCCARGCGLCGDGPYRRNCGQRRRYLRNGTLVLLGILPNDDL